MEPNTRSRINKRLSVIIPRKHHLLVNNNESLSSCKSLSFISIPHYPPKTIKTNTFKKISNQIAFIPNKNEKEKNTQGGLYTLFSSNSFDINLLLYYLDTKEENGIIDTLVHLLNIKFKNEIIRYLPQLVSILLSKKSALSIQSFLLSNCRSSIAFALKVEWLLNSFYSKVLLKKNQKLIRQFIHLFQKKQIENRREVISTKDESNYDYKDYYERITQFYNCILSIENIKAKTNEDFLIQIKKTVSYCNKLIGNMRRIVIDSKSMAQEMKNVYRGFILPIDNKLSRIDDQEQFIITNIIEEKILLCYSQNNNVKSLSYLIPFECIEVKEGLLWNDKVIMSQEDNKENEVGIVKSEPLEENKQNNASIALSLGESDHKSLCDSSYLKLNPFDIFREEIENEIKQKSIFKQFPSYTIKHFILKTKADYSNEMIIMQMVYLFSSIFKNADIPLRLTPFQIELLSESVILIEQIPNTISLIELYQKIEGKMNLNTFFRNYFCNNFEEAQKNLVETLAGYCLVSYLINSQEKISENLLLDVSGKVILKKFGNCFAPTNNNYSMFQLSKDIMEIIDGNNSAMFHYYKSLILKGLIEIKKHVEVFIKLIESEIKSLRITGFSDKDRKSIITALTERFHLTYSIADIVFKVEEMVK